MHYSAFLLTLLLIAGYATANTKDTHVATQHKALANKGTVPNKASTALESPALGDAHYFNETLWLTKKLKSRLPKNIALSYMPIRFKYRTLSPTLRVWEIKAYGKENLIDYAVTVSRPKSASEKHTIHAISVFKYREPRGGEIQQSWFLEQFTHAFINADHRLSVNVDNISGATISVDATKDVVALALWLDENSG